VPNKPQLWRPRAGRRNQAFWAPPGAPLLRRDSIEPVTAIKKELNLQFVICYKADEFAATVRNIAKGYLPVEQLLDFSVPDFPGDRKARCWNPGNKAEP
jgi:threonine dehydrogenase-like Zn-dependent dehydrogenase